MSRRIARFARALLGVLVIAMSLPDAARATVAFDTTIPAVAVGTNALSVPHPATVAAGDLLVLVVGNKHPNNAPTTPGGWTLELRAQGGSGASGTDTGQVFMSVYTKIAAGNEDGTNLAVSIPSGNASMGRMFRFTKTTATASWDTATTSGAQNTTASNWSVTGGANLGFTAGDMALVATAVNSDTSSWSAPAITAAGGGVAFAATERQDSGTTNGNDMRMVVATATVTGGPSTGAPTYTMTDSIGAPAANTNAGVSVFLLIRETRTTIATGTDPAAATVGPVLTNPGVTTTDVNEFTLQTNSGTEAITTVTVNLSTNTGVGRLAITDDTPTELGFTIAPVTGANVITVAGMSASTTTTTFRVRVTPALHSGTAPPPVMPAVPGGTYAVTAPVTAWAGNNFHTGTDTTANTLSIDNASPANVTLATATYTTPGQVSLSWTNPVTADFVAGGTVLVIRRATATADVPTEGVTYTVGNTVGTSTVACVVTGSPPATSCVDSGLTGGVYHYRIYTQDSRGNYSQTGVVPTNSGGTVLHTVSAFNACEVYSPSKCSPGTVDYDRLFTKLASTAFSLDLVAVRSGGNLNTDFAGSPTVELLAYTTAQASLGANSCPIAAPTATIAVAGGAYAAGRRNISLAANAFSSVAPNYSAYRDVRVRVTCNAATCPPSGITWCSADNFAVRPTNITVSAPVLTNALQTGTPRATAGSDFSLTANALTATAAAAAGYNGQPVLDRTLAGQKVTTHGGLTDYTDRLRDTAGGSGVTFATAAIATGISTGTTLQYHDAGNFRVLANGLVDSSWTAVDDTTKDCVGGSSSIADNDANANNGLKYGCNIGNQANSALFGRFYPNHYVLSSSNVTPACAGGFSYMGHAAIALGYTLSAMSQDNPTGATLKLSKYTAGYGTLAAVGVLSENGTVGTDLTTNISPTLTGGSWSAGDYAVSGSTFSFSRATLSGPYDSFYIGASVTDSDGATLNGRDFKLGDPACTVACTHKLLSATPTRIRFGRLRLLGASGSETLNLPLTLRTEYWTGTGFATNTLDNCTALTPDPARKFVLYDHQGSVTAGNMVSPTGVPPAGSDGNVSASGVFSGGTTSLVLQKPSGASGAGSVRVCLDLDQAAGGDTTCQAPVPGNLVHLQGNWSGGSYDKDPNARAAFGVYSAQPRQFIFIRENY